MKGFDARRTAWLVALWCPLLVSVACWGRSRHAVDVIRWQRTTVRLPDGRWREGSFESIGLGRIMSCPVARMTVTSLESARGGVMLAREVVDWPTGDGPGYAWFSSFGLPPADARGTGWSARRGWDHYPPNDYSGPLFSPRLGFVLVRHYWPDLRAYPNPRESRTLYALVVPYWAVSLLAAVPALLSFRIVRSEYLRSRPGHCPECGYDVRATPERCPECGWAPPAGSRGTPAPMR